VQYRGQLNATRGLKRIWQLWLRSGAAYGPTGLPQADLAFWWGSWSGHVIVTSPPHGWAPQ
jgi:hypothetical protein